MKVEIRLKNKGFINFDNDLSLWKRIKMAYGIIRNWDLIFNFKKAQNTNQKKTI